jgi:hypothetical protein
MAAVCLTIAAKALDEGFEEESGSVPGEDVGRKSDGSL